MADTHAKHHDYHLVDPSPWPIVGSLSAFLMAIGAILWMHHLTPAAPYIFGVGVVGVAYTMIGWWRDVAPSGHATAPRRCAPTRRGRCTPPTPARSPWSSPTPCACCCRRARTGTRPRP